MNHVHFISGLPRSGSTLLAAILKQNPRFHAGMTSPLGLLFTKILNSLSTGSEFGPVVNDEQRRRLLKGLFSSYYADQDEKEVIIDTNRAWCGRMNIINDLWPDARIICCVRNPAWIMDSIERLYRANPYETTKLFNDDGERDSVYSRTRALARSDRMVGFALRVAKEAYYGEFADKLLVLEYDRLVRQPEHCLNQIYRFIGEPAYSHDFENIEYHAQSFDLNLGVPTLHQVRSKVSAEVRATILPPDLFQEYATTAFWQDINGTKAALLTRRPKPQTRLQTPPILNDNDEGNAK